MKTSRQKRDVFFYLAKKNMNEIHLHLLTNHLPIVGILIATPILLVGLILKKKDVVSTGIFTMLFSGIGAYIAHVTGEKAEHIAEDIPGITESLIEHHEEASQPFFLLMLAIAVISLLAIFIKKSKPQLFSYASYFLAIAGIVACVLSYEAGKSGGEIRHEEIREGYILPSVNSSEEAHEESH